VLCGCTNTITQTPAGIEIYGLGMNAQEIADKAEAHCRQYGLDAQLKDADRGAFNLESYQHFDCVKTNGSANTDNKSTSK
jgi:hypothetical protein